MTDTPKTITAEELLSYTHSLKDLFALRYAAQDAAHTIRKLEAELEILREIADRNEWEWEPDNYHGGPPYCRFCLAIPRNGHDKDCPYIKLAELRKESE